MSLPNIILIVLDTFRADKIIINNDETTYTPFIKELIKKSIYFKNCISHSPWTLPSHVTIFTGLYPSQNNLFNPDFDHINNKIPTLTEILKKKGYHTICFSENAFISKIYGFHRGFDKILNLWDWNPWVHRNYKLSRGITLLNKFDKIITKYVKLKLIRNLWTHLKVRMEETIKSIIKFFFLKDILFKLKNNTLSDLQKFEKIIKSSQQTRPFFVFFNFLSTHDPYVPIYDVFSKKNIRINLFKDIRDILIFPLKSRLKINIKSNKLNVKEIRTINELYNHCVLSADQVIKNLFSLLANLKLDKNTYIIITSDHGEHLGGEMDHFFWEHNTYQSVYDSLVRVPLILINPSLKQQVVEKQVQLKDLFHTILHLTGIPSSQNEYFDLKKSIIQQLDSNSTPDYIFGEYVNSRKDMLELINVHRRKIDRKLIPKIFNHIYFLRSNKYKYIKFDKLDIEEFYDLEKDPFELNSSIKINKSKFYEMKKLFDEKMKEISNYDSIKSIITHKEKESLKNIVQKINIKGI